MTMSTGQSDLLGSAAGQLPHGNACAMGRYDVRRLSVSLFATESGWLAGLSRLRSGRLFLVWRPLRDLRQRRLAGRDRPWSGLPAGGRQLVRLRLHAGVMDSGTGPARLLVVDDEATILELLSGSLRLAGFEVVTAASGAEAVQAAASSRPDLVLLDVMMPDGDGFDALRRIRSGGSEVPVIFLTARDEVPDRVRGFDVGGDDYVTKPFSLEELLGRIRAVLKRTQLAIPDTRLRVADLELDDDAHEVRRDGAVVALTATEYRLL